MLNHCTTLYYSSRAGLLQAKSPAVVPYEPNWLHSGHTAYSGLSTILLRPQFLWEGAPLTTSTTGDYNITKRFQVYY